MFLIYIHSSETRYPETEIYSGTLQIMRTLFKMKRWSLFRVHNCCSDALVLQNRPCICIVSFLILNFYVYKPCTCHVHGLSFLYLSHIGHHECHCWVLWRGNFFFCWFPLWGPWSFHFFWLINSYISMFLVQVILGFILNFVPVLICSFLYKTFSYVILVGGYVTCVVLEAEIEGVGQGCISFQVPRCHNHVNIFMLIVPTRRLQFE